MIRLLKLLQTSAIAKDPHARAFGATLFEDHTLRRDYSDYLFGEVRDSFTFYYNQSDFESFVRFFSHLEGRMEFKYEYFLQAFGSYLKAERGLGAEAFLQSAESFLQLLYDLNVVCYFEFAQGGQRFIRWSYRERSFANVRPKVELHCIYSIFQPLHKALNLGQTLSRNRKAR